MGRGWDVSQLGASLQKHAHNWGVLMPRNGFSKVSVCNCGNSQCDHGEASGALATHKPYPTGFLLVVRVHTLSRPPNKQTNKHYLGLKPRTPGTWVSKLFSSYPCVSDFTSTLH